MSVEIENFKLLLQSKDSINIAIGLGMANNELELQKIVIETVKLPEYKLAFCKALDFDWFVKSAQVQKITELSLSYLRIEEIPESVFLLKNLEKLYLNTNRIKSISEDLGRLKKLRYLDLSENQLMSIPKSIGNLRYLIGMHLSYNKITSIPDSIGKMKSLEYFRIDSNHLMSLPSSIGDLKNLKVLDLSFNELTVLDSSITKLLQNLTDLQLHHNKLTVLPDSFSNLQNDFQKKYSSKRKSTSKLLINLESNPIVWVPKEIEGMITSGSLHRINTNKTILYASMEKMNILLGNNINSFAREDQQKKLFEKYDKLHDNMRQSGFTGEFYEFILSQEVKELVDKIPFS